MIEHIELVKKWVADPESVTKQELRDNLLELLFILLNSMKN